MALSKLGGLNPEVRNRAEAALQWAALNRVPVTITSGARSCEEQARLRARWLAGLTTIPANEAGDSAHNFGLAFDSTTAPDPFNQWAWRFLREWVGFAVPTNDPIHAEVPGWRRFVSGGCG